MWEVMPIVVSSVVGGGGIGLIVKAFLDQRGVRAKANLDDTTATVAITDAAIKLLDPLKSQLAEVRQEHEFALAAERRKVAEVQEELDALKGELKSCTAELRDLRNELAMARVETDELRRGREMDRAKIRVLESMLRRKSSS